MTSKLRQQISNWYILRLYANHTINSNTYNKKNDNNNTCIVNQEFYSLWTRVE